MRVVNALGLFLALLHFSSSLLLGAFNIKSFGNTKADNGVVMDIISKIVNRYDIILIQEVRDSDLSATQKLMGLVNNVPHITYNYVVSEPLGDNTYKERYLFLYRTQTVSVDAKGMFNNIAFKRAPFVVMFSSKLTAVKNFVLIPQHTSPRSAVKEVDALFDVVADVRTSWKTNYIVLLGDFNAGCRYVKAANWPNIRLFTDNSFHWLIANDVDTTVSESKCPYDRIVVTSDMLTGVVSGSAKVYNFRQIFGLQKSAALNVSDHFPVEVELS